MVDNITLKCLIIEMRDDEKLSFQEIADKLFNEYGVKRSRQGLRGLYNRAKEQLDEAGQSQIERCDIVNLYCLCENASSTAEELSNIGHKVSYRRVLDVVEAERAYINSVRNTIIATIESKIKTKEISDIRDIENLITYKGVKICKKRIIDYIELAYIHYVKKEITNELSGLFKITDNKSIVRRVASKFNIDITAADLREAQDAEKTVDENETDIIFTDEHE